MVAVFSDVIQFKGTHYDFGVLQGEKLKHSPSLANRKKYVFAKRKRNYLINEQAYKDVIHRFMPAMWDEINGLADALDMKIIQAIEQFGGYYLDYQQSGCSIYTGKDYFVRNYDFHPRSYDGRYMLYQPSDSGYATIGPSMQITGRTDGMNEKGLTMGYNFVNRRGSEDGFLCNMIGRIILENCTNVQDAINLLHQLPHRNAFSYVLLDQKGISKVVEASPRKVVVRDAHFCTNHFETLTAENRFHLKDSLRRKQLLLEKGDKVAHAYDAFRMMNHVEENIYGTNYGSSSGTLHTAIYYPRQLKAGLSLSANRPPYLFDFNEWLKGERLTVTKVKGQLNASSPFANMIQPK